MRLPSLRVARGPRHWHLPRSDPEPRPEDLCAFSPDLLVATGDWAQLRAMSLRGPVDQGPQLASQRSQCQRHAMPASRRLALLGQHLGRTTEEPRASGPLTAVPTGLLKGIDPLLTAELLYVLRMAGHGDVISIVDCNFPAAEVASKTFYGKVFGTRAASGPLSLLSGWQAGPSAIAVCHFPCVVCAMRSRSCSLA